MATFTLIIFLQINKFQKKNQVTPIMTLAFKYLSYISGFLQFCGKEAFFLPVKHDRLKLWLHCQHFNCFELFKIILHVVQYNLHVMGILRSSVWLLERMSRGRSKTSLYVGRIWSGNPYMTHLWRNLSHFCSFPCFYKIWQNDTPPHVQTDIVWEILDPPFHTSNKIGTKTGPQIDYDVKITHTYY